MTPHNHSAYVDGCYRCELNKDEVLFCYCGEPDHEPNDACPGGDGDLTDCPYFRRYAGVPGADPEGICSHGCREEPSCVTDRPIEGWPREAALSTSTPSPRDRGEG